MYDRSTVISVAEGEVGYLEKASNSNLDSKTGNAGKNNWTKYARDLDALGDFYNGAKNGYDWCDIFVDWCFVTAYGREAAQYLLCQPNGSYGAGCGCSANYYRQKGRFDKTPSRGAQIFFIRNGAVCHTGLVVEVKDGRVYTVEGNTSGGSNLVSNGGGVARKSYPVSSSVIYGYGHPDYDDANMTPEDRKDVCEVELPYLKKGCSGGHVKSMQILLKNYFDRSIATDGSFGAQTERVLKRYQESRGLYADGECGAKTWAKLLS